MTTAQEVERDREMHGTDPTTYKRLTEYAALIKTHAEAVAENARLKAAMDKYSEQEDWRHLCPACSNRYMQPFVCTTCGAQKLYDATLAIAEKRLALAVAALKHYETLRQYGPTNIARETLAQIEEGK